MNQLKLMKKRDYILKQNTFKMRDYILKQNTFKMHFNKM